MSGVAEESKLLARHSVIYGLGPVLSSIVAILLLPIYTRYLTPADYGIKELIGLTIDLIGMLLATGISSGVLRFYFEYDDEKDRKEVISTATIGLSTVAFIFIVVLFFFTKPMASWIIDSPELYYYFNIALVSMWFNSINNIGLAYLRAKQKSILYVLCTFFRLLAVVSFNIYFIVFLKLGVLGVLLSTLIVAVITTCVLNIPILFIVKARFSKFKFGELTRFGMPLVPGQLVQFVAQISNRFFLKTYCSLADVGLYSLGAKFGTIPSTFISMPFNQIWQTRRFELYKQKGSEELFGRIFTYYLALVSFAGLAVAVLTKDLLTIMAKPAFWNAYSIVPIIVLGNIILSMTYHFDMGLLIEKKTKFISYINGLNGILLIILNFIMIPKYGIHGAAYAMLISFFNKTILTYYFSKKFYAIHFEFSRIAKIIGSAIFLFYTISMLDIANIYYSFAIKSMLILFFPAVLLIVGFFSQKEKEKISRFMRNCFSSKI